ncbi:hypothetical protein [Alienimonas chondri]|uniref:Uncharacterized protein n=1 Tax=Alienimonas chondri TaxID=2681879 RepID=A0ABX1VAY5_9PLAN|nr:hypothetical protein [Alienimonas chondri]NNJ24196.1 hypothetical protein [Alienimonas chondri]
MSGDPAEKRSDPPTDGAAADAELAESVPGERRRGSAGAVHLTPKIYFAGWLGVLSPVIAWAVVSASAFDASSDAVGPALAVSLLALLPAWPAGCLGAGLARMERDRRGENWPLWLTDAVGGFVGGNLLGGGFIAMIVLS